MSTNSQQQTVKTILGDRECTAGASGHAFAPVNIALCKYWGKRDEELNLPVTSSLSISLGTKGTEVSVEAVKGPDRYLLNGEEADPAGRVAERLKAYLDLFRPAASVGYRVSTESNVPMAAGLASSAAAFAALVKALDALYGWELDGRSLSILARMGSGSASRSVYDGFVEWHVGLEASGMDSFAEPLDARWPELRVGLVTVSAAPKKVGSREAMKRTTESCALYEAWPLKVADDLVGLKDAIRERDFTALGTTAESNALSMHATMVATWPPVLYWQPESVEMMHRVWALRAEGLPLYFTMDAGPNLKLLFEESLAEEVADLFPGVETIRPFG